MGNKVCNCEATNRSDISNGKIVSRCSICKGLIIRKKQKYMKAIEWLKSNGFVVEVVEPEGRKVTLYPIKEDIMECVNDIISKMKARGYVEKYRDTTVAEYGGCEIDVVNYLYFELHCESGKDTRSVLDAIGYYISLIKN